MLNYQRVNGGLKMGKSENPPSGVMKKSKSLGDCPLHAMFAMTPEGFKKKTHPRNEHEDPAI